MKKTLFSIAAAALVLTSMSAAHADDSSVQIKAKPARYYVTPGEFARLCGRRPEVSTIQDAAQGAT